MTNQGNDENSNQVVDFNGLILGFCSAALYYMGETPIDDQKASEVNFPLAKQNIDIIDLLKAKTQGNLAPEETKLLDQILTDLKLKYASSKK